MTIVLPHGVLFRGGSEEEIRKNLIEKNNIDAIIGLPANIFFGTGIPSGCSFTPTLPTGWSAAGKETRSRSP